MCIYYVCQNIDITGSIVDRNKKAGFDAGVVMLPDVLAWQKDG